MYSATALWWRALRRVDRRAAITREAIRTHPEVSPFIHLTREGELLREACRLANRLDPQR